MIYFCVVLGIFIAICNAIQIYLMLNKGATQASEDSFKQTVEDDLDKTSLRMISYAYEQGLNCSVQVDSQNMLSLFETDGNTLFKISDIYVNGDDTIKRHIDNYKANKHLIREAVKNA